MPTFLFSYRVPNIPLQERLAEMDASARAEAIARWNSWMESLGASLLDRGNRVADARKLGKCDGDTRSGGYSLVTAEDLEAAVALAKGCPGLEMGGGVEVGLVAALPPSATS
jgi:hypothetical protein